jgi:hypothetical protein
MINSKRLWRALADAVKSVVAAGILGAFVSAPAIYIMVNYTPNEGGLMLIAYMVFLIIAAVTATNYAFGKDE